ncbi:hypothetical protein OEA41_006368 [Lepraria neglecta]|uniref:ferroxidase n=1 Tax=Lepraria neglecta TaxID=209136 RepID=A0AAD9Z7V3_9LECA|nr:hypothetical protein OEA41_006368 [Lepraria neglecta]
MLTNANPNIQQVSTQLLRLGCHNAPSRTHVLHTTPIHPRNSIHYNATPGLTRSINAFRERPVPVWRMGYQPPICEQNQHQSQHFRARTFSAASTLQAAPPVERKIGEPAAITVDVYHKISDAYIDALLAQLEELQEEREDVDVEYSAGVLTLTFPPHGTYVLNKQPPNKQIWLSSPVSGPKRYDWVAGEGGKGTGEAEGEWVYLRDGSTLSGLLEGEVGVVAGGVWG